MSESPATDTFDVVHASRSDLGMRRSNNQDALAVELAARGDWAQQGHFFMVADGMGAHAAGELASKLAVDNIPHHYRKARNQPAPAALRQAVRMANEQIFAKGQSSGEFHGMGTTCSCLVLLPGKALVAHVGDSRVYRLRGTKLEQLTFDHSLVWEMAAASHTTADKVPACIPKNVITRSLGPHKTVNIDLEGPFTALPGDRYLLCSDGLTAVIEDKMLGALMQVLSPDEVVDTLVGIANLRGGPDNISIVVARVAGEIGAAVDCSQIRCHRHCLKRMIAGGLVALAGLSATVMAAMISNPLLAVVGAFAMLGGLVLAANRREMQIDASSHEWGGPYGNGPYREYHCDVKVDALPALSDTLDQLLELETSQHAVSSVRDAIDWSHYSRRRGEAAAVADRGELAKAVVLYSAAIRELLAALRSRKTQPDESGILQL
jgi:protein phosphatase